MGSRSSTALGQSSIDLGTMGELLQAFFQLDHHHAVAASTFQLIDQRLGHLAQFVIDNDPIVVQVVFVRLEQTVQEILEVALAAMPIRGPQVSQISADAAQQIQQLDTKIV